jgi:hypothetical protein
MIKRLLIEKSPLHSLETALRGRLLAVASDKEFAAGR